MTQPILVTRNQSPINNATVTTLIRQDEPSPSCSKRVVLSAGANAVPCAGAANEFGAGEGIEVPDAAPTDRPLPSVLKRRLPVLHQRKYFFAHRDEFGLGLDAAGIGTSQVLAREAEVKAVGDTSR